MERVNVVPSKITVTLDSLKPKMANGCKIEPETQMYYPPDFLEPLYEAYCQNFGQATRSYAVAKMSSIIYRIVMKIPELKHLASVLYNDNDFAQAVGFPMNNWKGIPRDHAYVGCQGLNSLYQELMYLENVHKVFTKSLHNLADELDYKDISFDGLIPAVWVEYYRIKKVDDTLISVQEFEAICANNTGIAVIDDLTQYMALDLRGDIRQDAALQCLELGLDLADEDAIAEIARKVMRKYSNERIQKAHREKSLFSKPFNDSDTELWQLIASQ